MAQQNRPSKKRAMAMAMAMAEADALISFPPDVINAILTRLPLPDAVRTSALSRIWRRRWEALPSLDLDSPPLEAVDSILLRCPGRVQRFHVDVDEISVRRIDDWLLILSRRGVESLKLGSALKDKLFALHSSVFSCVGLTALDLVECLIPPLPAGFAGFPNLRDLTLSRVKLQEKGGLKGEHQLEKIIGMSPLLEVLMLSDVNFDGDSRIEWVIRLPNLRSLKIYSQCDSGWKPVDLPRLHYAFLNLWEYVGDRNFAEFLSGLVQVRKLDLWAAHEPLNGGNILETLPCMFNNLKSLRLFMHFCELPPILLTFHLMTSAPNLEKLKIEIFGAEEQNIEANEEFQNAQWTDGMCPNLQVVQLTGISWLSNEMSFIQLILSKARLLRSLCISHGAEIAMSNEDALNELLKYRRASPQAQVLFEGEADY